MAFSDRVPLMRIATDLKVELFRDATRTRLTRSGGRSLEPTSTGWREQSDDRVLVLRQEAAPEAPRCGDVGGGGSTGEGVPLT